MNAPVVNPDSPALIHRRPPRPRHRSAGSPADARLQIGLQSVLVLDQDEQDRASRKEQVPNGRDADRVPHLSALAMLGDQARPTEDGELLAEIARLDLDPVEQLVDRMIPLAQELQDANPGRMPESPEEFSLGLVERNRRQRRLPWSSP